MHNLLEALDSAANQVEKEPAPKPGLKTYRIVVPGIPQPGGSKKGFVVADKYTGKARAVVTEDNKKSKPWRNDVQWMAKLVMLAGPLRGPLAVEFVFILPRPKGHMGAKGLRPSAPPYPAVKPDTTKLTRSTEDALKGIAWVDDSQIVDQHARKIYAAPGCSLLGAIITITDLAAVHAGAADYSGGAPPQTKLACPDCGGPREPGTIRCNDCHAKWLAER
jgi:Holliday junction resolvase RusA-like endonuclease